MGSHRQRRVEDLIRQQLAELLLREAQDPRFGQASITAVDVSPDLKHARVYFSVLGDDADAKELLGVFEKASGYLRKELASRVRLRYMPELVFRFDSSLSDGDRIERLLRQISEEGSTSEESGQ
jgi:ribosome-binding factor A